MARKSFQKPLIAALLAGSLWIFSEIVLGAMVKAMALPLRGTLMTCIGVAILLLAFALTRRIWVVSVAVLLTVLGKILFTPTYGAGFWMVLNSSTAVFLEGVAIIAVVYFVLSKSRCSFTSVAMASGCAILCAGTAFYVIGTNLAPCPYLLQFSSVGFLLRESIPWALTSALTATMGYGLGRKLKYHYLKTEALPQSVLPAYGMIAGCWVACVVVSILVA